MNDCSHMLSSGSELFDAFIADDDIINAYVSEPVDGRHVAAGMEGM